MFALKISLLQLALTWSVLKIKLLRVQVLKKAVSHDEVTTYFQRYNCKVIAKIICLPRNSVVIQNTHLIPKRFLIVFFLTCEKIRISFTTFSESTVKVHSPAAGNITLYRAQIVYNPRCLA